MSDTQTPVADETATSHNHRPPNPNDGDIEAALGLIAALAKEAPAFVAMFTDIVDDAARRAADSGIDVQERCDGLLGVLEKLTRRENIAALHTLLDRLPQLAEAATLLAELPKLTAVFGDVFDEWAQRMAAEGIDIETSVKQGLHASLWLGQRVTECELERLGILLRSEVIDPQTLTVIGRAGSSLKRCQLETCEIDTPPRVGPYGLLKALFDPNIQKSVAFGLRFARCFGQAADHSVSSHESK